MKRLKLATLTALSLPLLLLAAVASELTLPKWDITEEPWSAWTEIRFRDSSNQEHTLWCQTQACRESSGTVNLFVFKQTGQEEFQVPNGWPQWLRGTHAAFKTSFSTELSQYVLELDGNNGVIKSRDGSFSLALKSFNYTGPPLVAQGSLRKVAPPNALAKDAPKAAAPATPAAAAVVPAPTGTPSGAKKIKVGETPPAPADAKKPETAVAEVETRDPSSLEQDELAVLLEGPMSSYMAEWEAAKEDPAKMKEVVAKYRSQIEADEAISLKPEELAKFGDKKALVLKRIRGTQGREARGVVVGQYRRMLEKHPSNLAALMAAVENPENFDKLIDGKADEGTVDARITPEDEEDASTDEEEPAGSGEADRKRKADAERIEDLNRQEREAKKGLRGGKVPNLTDDQYGPNKSNKPEPPTEDPNKWRDPIAGLKVGVLTGLIGFILGGPIAGLLFGVAGICLGYLMSTEINK
jgi:hypothetical protein